MAIIEFPTGPPYGDIPVNTETLYAALPDNATPATMSELMIDAAGSRSIEVLLPIDQVGQVLGRDFVRFEMARTTPAFCYASRKNWVSIVPHPQIPNVAQINFRNNYIAVKGTVAQARAALT